MNNDGINKSGRKVTNPKGNLANLTGMGKGRPAGIPNIINRDIKEMMIQALNGVGGVEYLMRQAEKNPNAFIGLLGKILPTQITGVDGGPVLVITGVVRADEADKLESPTIEGIKLESPATNGKSEPPAIERETTVVQSIEVEPEVDAMVRAASAPSAPPRAPYMPPPRPHPLPEYAPATPAVPGNQLLGSRTTVTESGVRLRSSGLLAPWS